MMSKLTEYRRSQIRENARTFRQKQLDQGLRQYSFWLTDEQVKQIRKWLKGDGERLPSPEDDDR
ncbi:hypothetical protein [Acidithiobacillus thiooxidans]|uniref:hypothetical protein n=1 Tax=Acidithiobacillus thiooxidans TaxID=930 RepID=UPI001C06D6A1|nr:hypothetical protein [Acidithiobacillus thiooxidans]MBU2843572.1 hypothetical protein [Acidithiobacillus thiooxidans]